MGGKVKQQEGETKMGYKAGTEYRVRMACAFMATALLLTCCSMESSAEAPQTQRTWNGFVYDGYDEEEYYAEMEGRPVNKSVIRLNIINYKGPERELTIPTEIDGMRVEYVYSLSKAKNLRTLHIPNGVKVYGAALQSVRKLKKITVSKSNKRYSVKNNALLNKKGDVLMGYPGGYDTLKVPDSVTRITGCYNSRFKYIKWGKNVRRIGDAAFADNRRIQTLTVKGKVEVVGKYAFSDCKELKKVVLGKNVRLIKFGAFEGCKKLKSIYIYNRNCKIVSPGDYGISWLAIPKQATIYGWRGSTAEKFAKKYKIKFQELKE